MERYLAQSRCPLCGRSRGGGGNRFGLLAVQPVVQGAAAGYAERGHDARSAAPATPSASAAAPSSIASTPDQDNKYVQDLNDHGISFANPEAAVYNGKVVCDDIGKGMTVPQIIAAFRSSNPGLDADTYVTISVRAYCPQNGNLVGGSP